MGSEMCIRDSNNNNNNNNHDNVCSAITIIIVRLFLARRKTTKTLQGRASTIRLTTVALSRQDSVTSSQTRKSSTGKYASPRLWNQLPASVRQPCTNLSNSDAPSSSSGTSSISSIYSPLSSFITPSLFHSGLKIFLYCKSFPP